MDSLFIEQFRAALRRYVDMEHDGIVSRAERALGLAQGSGLLHKWLRGERIPSLLQASPLFPLLGITFRFPSDSFPDIPLSKNPQEDVAELRSRLAAVTSERDRLRGQVDLLKELIQKK